MELLLRLGHGSLLAEKEWRDLLTDAGLQVLAASTLHTDGLCLFACRTPRPAAVPARKPARHPATPA